MKLYSSQSCQVEHIAERLEIMCSPGLESRAFRYSMMKALRYARSHMIKQWLYDLRSIGRLSEEEETWVQVQLYPQMMLHMGANNHVALVIEVRDYQEMVQELGISGLESCNSFIIMNTFCDKQEAVDWLVHRHSECA